MSTGLLHLLCVLMWGYSALTVSSLSVKYAWSSIEFLYDNKTLRERDIGSGYYNPHNVVMLDSDFYNNNYFATTPRLTLSGTPATLSIITKDYDSNGSYLLKPFPDWSWHNISTCDAIVSVFRIKIDKLGRMWVVDCGIVAAFTEDFEMICPPKLLVFDLNSNNTLIAKYEFPPDQISEDTLLLNTEIQILDEKGEQTVAYIADASTYKLFVYHLARNESFVIEHPSFSYDSAYENYNVNGVSFSLTDGLFSLALDASQDLLYYHSLSSGYEYQVKAKILRKRRALTEEEKSKYFKRLPYQKKNHTSVEVLANQFNETYLIFPILEKNALYAWNTKKKYTSKNFKLIAKNKTLDFVSGAKILMKENQSDELIVTSSRLQNLIAYGKNEIGKINFRILQGKVTDLLRGY